MSCDHTQCSVCGEFYNKCNLSEVVEHMHKDKSTAKEYFGKRKDEETTN